jgi:hypothetical protein
MNRSRASLCCLLLTLLFLAACRSPRSFEGIRLSQGDWNIGTIPDTKKRTLRLSIANESGMNKRLSILATCPCLLVEKSPVELSPGEKFVESIMFDPSSGPGPINVMLAFLTDAADSKGYLFRVYGSVSDTHNKR